MGEPESTTCPVCGEGTLVTIDFGEQQPAVVRWGPRRHLSPPSPKWTTSGVFMRRVNRWLPVFWLVMIPVSIATHWISSVTYRCCASFWALVSGHWSAWQAARVEVNQQAEAEARGDQDLQGEIVEPIVSETQIEGDVQRDREPTG